MNGLVRHTRFVIGRESARPEAGYLFTVEPVTEFGRRAERCRLRIALLIAAMSVMGLCDLYCTVTYMQSVGMVELNPLARAIAATGDVPYLVGFKIALMIISGAFLYMARGHRLAEPMAWVCAAVLTALMIHWANYNREVPALTNEMVMMAMDGGEGFVRIGS